MKDSQVKKKKRLFKKKILTPNSKKVEVLQPPKSPRVVFKKTEFLKKHEANLFFFLIPLILLTVLYILTSLNSKVLANIEKYKLVSSSSQSIAPYPVVQNLAIPEVTAKAAIVLDSVSQKIIYSKNPHLRFSMASTVKIMTALTAMDYYKKDSVLTIKSYLVEGSGLNLAYGDKFYFNDLMYAMMLPSANDAAAAIADNYPGGRESFVAKMNEKAFELHLADTHYSDPIGLNDDGDYSTVIDIGRLGSAGMKNSEFANVVSTRQKIISNISQTRQYNFINLNRLLGTHGVNGIKTGTTEGAGEVLVTSAVQNGHTFIVVVMNSRDRFSDTEKLLDFAANNVSFVIPVIK